MINTKKTGRSNKGKICINHRGGGVKRVYKSIIFSMVEFKDKIGTVQKIIYDPNRNCPVILVFFETGEKGYFLKPEGINIGDKFAFLTNTSQIYFENGIRSYIKNIAVGSKIHNIILPFEFKPGNFVRSGGSFATVLSVSNNFSVIKLPSKEIRLIPSNSCATIGILDIIKKKKKTAGSNRRLGKRPTVRGTAKNAKDHPHGGGEGKSPIGRRSPLTPWGKKTLGFKTVKKKRDYILQSKE